MRLVFLYWLPFILRMHRPTGRGTQMPMEYPPTPCSNNSEQPNKSHHHLPPNNHLNILTDVELKQRCSKSLLANVLDINDDFRHNNCRPLLPGGGVGSSSTLPPNSSYFRTVFRYEMTLDLQICPKSLFLRETTTNLIYFEFVQF